MSELSELIKINRNIERQNNEIIRLLKRIAGEENEGEMTISYVAPKQFTPPEMSFAFDDESEIEVEIINVSILQEIRAIIVEKEKEMEEVAGTLYITTDDGSYMKKGYAIDYLKEDHEKNNFDVIFACGPTPMLKAVKSFGEEKTIYTEISLEERMGCGVGACLGCATKILTEDGFKYGHVCKDGPVFDATRVEL